MVMPYLQTYAREWGQELHVCVQKCRSTALNQHVLLYDNVYSISIFTDLNTAIVTQHPCLFSSGMESSNVAVNIGLILIY